jgi:hypothetical protein
MRNQCAMHVMDLECLDEGQRSSSFFGSVGLLECGRLMLECARRGYDLEAGALGARRCGVIIGGYFSICT